MPQLARWLTFIEEFDYEAVQRDGKKHTNADGLSRRAGPLAAIYEEAIEFDSNSTSCEQVDMVFHDAVTEQDEAISSELRSRYLARNLFGSLTTSKPRRS